MSLKLKVYELAKELGLDPQHLVDVAQRLGVDVKNTMSVLGSEEVRNVRDYVKKNKTFTSKSKKVVEAPTTILKTPVTEKRVGATLIRRRSKKEEAPPVEEKVEVEEKTVLEVQEEPLLVAAELPSEDLSSDSTPTQVQEEVSVEKTPEVIEAPPQVAAKEVVAKAAAVVPKVEVVAPPARRFFPSIIKKVGTEEHLSEKVGPKIERPLKKEVRPGTYDKSRPTGTIVPKVTTPTTGQTLGTSSFLGGPKKVKEVDSAATEAAKEASKRRLLERQNVVFKSADYLKRELVHSTKKKKAIINRQALKTQITTPADHKRVVEMGAKISVAELAKAMGVKGPAVVSKLMGMGVTATLNEKIDQDTASLVAHEFQHEIKNITFKEEEFIPVLNLAPENLKPRPPVVTIMGHVDHGKTSLLDAIRKTKVASGEAGGITQHIGAYTVTVPKGKITFVDTPGHEAFTAMRARGAKVTDIVVLVVSAVDGVMPQTIESLNHAQAANVPVIVAVNKIDLPDANPDRIRQNLAGQNLNPEEWGGETIYVNVSAKTGKGLDQLLEAILLQAEILELKANDDTFAKGVVIESKLDKARGALATVLVQQGRLKAGDVIVSGHFFGKVRAMTDSFGKRVQEVFPSEPAEVLGLPYTPNVGDEFSVVADEKAAKLLTESRVDSAKAKESEGRTKPTMEQLLAQVGASEEKELRIVLKADVQGSCEALKESLMKLPSDKVKIKILHAGTGGITESDVMLVAASSGVILGFNIRPEVKAQKIAERDKVQIRTYSIIYDLLEDVKKILTGMLDVTVKEKVIGRAEVRNVFSIPKIGTIAGSSVVDGKVVRGCYLRLLRDSRVIYEGKISSLRRFKDDVKEVQTGYECGIGLENFSDLKLGDQFEAFIKEETKGIL